MKNVGFARKRASGAMAGHSRGCWGPDFYLFYKAAWDFILKAPLEGWVCNVLVCRVGGSGLWLVLL